MVRLALILFLLNFQVNAGIESCRIFYRNNVAKVERPTYLTAKIGSQFRWEWLQFRYLPKNKRPHHEIYLDGPQWKFAANQSVVSGRFEFVIGPNGNMYVGRKGKDISSHAAILRGTPIASGGIIVIENGKILAMTTDTGHYWEGFNAIGGNATNISQFMTELTVRGDDVSDFSVYNSFIVREGYRINELLPAN
ncbi:MAG: hypothetical protein JNL11_00230 [Bdellovibrionaceae bacterium]|nr:hypothetical protein [Pseudobdellovibrionaceae bacterium]